MEARLYATLGYRGRERKSGKKKLCNNEQCQELNYIARLGIITGWASLQARHHHRLGIITGWASSQAGHHHRLGIITG